jgi:hypothetical protein
LETPPRREAEKEKDLTNQLQQEKWRIEDKLTNTILGAQGAPVYSLLDKCFILTPFTLGCAFGLFSVRENEK